jgi:DNA-binding LacI/PurR family transcriptional regulator
VHVSIAELGGRAVETLLHAMVHKGAHTRRHQRLATTLVVRQSCGSRTTDKLGAHHSG